MKKIIIIFLCLVFSSLCYSQEPSLERGEIFIHIKDNPLSYVVTIKVSTENSYWLTDDDEHGIHDLSTNYDGD